MLIDDIKALEYKANAVFEATTAFDRARDALVDSVPETKASCERAFHIAKAELEQVCDEYNTMRGIFFTEYRYYPLPDATTIMETIDY